MKCKSCKFWKYNGFGTGICSGLSGQQKVVPLPDKIDKKGIPQKRGKLLRVRSGVISGLENRVLTPEDWYCKNWRNKC
jgi:hypothetical protein